MLWNALATYETSNGNGDGIGGGKRRPAWVFGSALYDASRPGSIAARNANSIRSRRTRVM